MTLSINKRQVDCTNAAMKSDDNKLSGRNEEEKQAASYGILPRPQFPTQFLQVDSYNSKYSLKNISHKRGKAGGGDSARKQMVMGVEGNFKNNSQNVNLHGVSSGHGTQ